MRRRNQDATGTEAIAWAIQRHVDFTDCKTSLSHHGRQISESESEAQGTATGESQQRSSEQKATGLSRQGGPEKEVGGRCQAAANLGSLGDSARLSWREGGSGVFDNGGRGRSDIEGKAVREAASKCGQRASFNGVHGNGRHGREWSALGSRDIDGKAARPIERERKSQARKVRDFTRSRNDSRGPNILTIGKCPATLPRSRLSVNRPSRPKDRQIFRE